jgi:hypothetical protein
LAIAAQINAVKAGSIQINLVDAKSVEGDNVAALVTYEG